MFGLSDIASRLICYGLLIAALIGAYAEWHHKIYEKGYVAGQASVQTKWDADKVARAKAQSQAVAAATIAKTADEKKDTQATKQVEVTYGTRTSKIHSEVSAERSAVATVGLRYEARIDRNRPAPSGQAASTSVDNAAGTEAVELPLKITESLLDIASDADEQIDLKDAKIQALQDWITSHGLYTP